jgi:hypothetical protein
VKIDEYFASIERSLRQTTIIHHFEKPVFCAASDDFNGVLRVRISFWSGAYLDIHETVNTELGYPVRIHYAYTFICNDIHVFRYDNAPHHNGIITFPHHKHIGQEERAAPSDQPTLNQVLAEIGEYLQKMV